MTAGLKEQAVEAWHVNNRVNLMLLDAIGEQGLSATLSKRGGRTVALQFAHLHNVRLRWLEAEGGDFAAGQTPVDKAGEVTRALLRKRLEESGEGIARWIARGMDDEGRVRRFKRGVMTMMGYMMTHDAHHRGNILLTLKQSGHRIPKELQFGIWDWDKV